MLSSSKLSSRFATAASSSRIKVRRSEHRMRISSGNGGFEGAFAVGGCGLGRKTGSGCVSESGPVGGLVGAAMWV